MHHKHTGIGVLIAFLTWSSVGILGSGPELSLMVSRVLEQNTSKQTPWQFITAEEVTNGLSLPTNTNVVFAMPKAISPSGVMTIQALVGTESTSIRYWGYCFPPDKSASLVKKETLPGKVFMSPAEQAARIKEWREKLPKYTAFNLPKSATELAKQSAIPPKGLIRNEKQVIYPEETCYITIGGKTALSIGIDADGDGLNSGLERGFRTDPENPDTDADGIKDGTELFRGHTNALLADSDSDGIQDGIEDADRDGRRDDGETDPLKRDSDGDGLCDGECVLGNFQSICATGSGSNCITALATWPAGEDHNRNGTVDSGETDPRKAYTDGYHNDMELYLDCRFEGKDVC